jgi:hypothetical protein
MTATASSNPAFALWLQSTRLAGRVAELIGSLGKYISLASVGCSYPPKMVHRSYKLLVIISQGCATYTGDCLFKIPWRR